VVAGAAEANVAETIYACQHALEVGARAVAIVSPFYFKLSPESVYAYFREIARETPIDVTLYNIPTLASPIDVTTVRRLAEECPRVIGIKDSSGDISHMQRLIAAVRPIRPEFAFFTGWDAALVPMLLAGCAGGVHATSGVVPEVTRAIYDDVRAGRVDAAFARQQQITDLLDIAFLGADFPEGFRIAAGLRGFAMGESRQPATDAQRADRQLLAERIRALIERCGVTR
jgi:4-hydroxy-tetrahydrodipicolinate synthase